MRRTEKYAALTRDEGNAVDGRFPTASSVKNEEMEPRIKAGCDDGKSVEDLEEGIYPPKSSSMSSFA
jgi:hypothetical protein